MRTAARVAALVGLRLVASGTLAAGAELAQWPQLWGPRVTAAVDDARGPFGAALRPLWRRPIGSALSGIAVEGGRAFTAESDGTLDHVLAIDTATGRTLWRVALGPTYRGHDGSRDGPISTPAVGGGRVFVAGPRGLLLALDAESGRELWRCDLPQQLQAKMPHYGFGASPILVGEYLVLQMGGQERSGLVAFEAANGRVAWSTQPAETKGDSTGYTMAAPAVMAGVQQLVAMGHDRVFSVRTLDGSLLWSHSLAEPEEPTRAVLPLSDSQVLLSRYSGAILLSVVREGDAWRVSEAWQSPRLKNSYSPNVHDGGFLYGFSGQFLLCVDAATGEPRWRQKVNAGSLIRVGPHLVVLGEQSGLLRIVEATPAAYRLVAEAPVFNAGAQSSTGPSYAGGRILVRNTEEIVALALEGGPARAEAREVRP